MHAISQSQNNRVGDRNEAYHPPFFFFFHFPKAFLLLLYSTVSIEPISVVVAAFPPLEINPTLLVFWKEKPHKTTHTAAGETKGKIHFQSFSSRSTQSQPSVAPLFFSNLRSSTAVEQITQWLIV